MCLSDALISVSVVNILVKATLCVFGDGWLLSDYRAHLCKYNVVFDPSYKYWFLKSFQTSYLVE